MTDEAKHRGEDASARELVLAELRLALEEADTAVLVLAYVHLTRDESVLHEAAPYVKPWDDGSAFPPEFAIRIRRLLLSVLVDAPCVPDVVLSRELVRRMMSTAVGEPVPEEYVDMMLEQTAMKPSILTKDAWAGTPCAVERERHHVAIIGAGMSGICAALQLRELGIPFTIFEKGNDVGGVWRDNVYPGCAVDTPNHYYSFSFEPNHEWSHYFSRRNEIHEYFRRCVENHDIGRSIRFGTNVVSAHYDESSAEWKIVVRQRNQAHEVVHARSVIFAVGQLNRPSIPRIAGLGNFQGCVAHTAEWPAGLQLNGRRVGIIGTGSSGMQLGPTIACEVERLVILQRSPHWAVKAPNYHRSVEPGKKLALRRIPFYATWYRFQLFWWSSDGLHPMLQVDPEWPLKHRSTNARSEAFRQELIEYMRSEVDGDPDLLRKIVPAYPPYGKRMVRDNNWYRMLKQPNVELVTTPIERIMPQGVEMTDGTRHELDILVFATGFRASEHLMPIEVRGKHGQSIHDVWSDEGPRAYLGITVPGFPNMFMICGPNTVVAHGGSTIFHTECAVRYIAQCLLALVSGGYSSLECRKDIHDQYNARVDDAHSRMVWTHPGCSNWFRHPTGRVTQASPWRQVDYWKLTSQLRVSDYQWQIRR
jgi:4-hydroxyacetophenone monooxygenase